MSLATGTKLGPYEILSPIGAGGMGEVYKAQGHAAGPVRGGEGDLRGAGGDANALARFEREAKAVAALSHPNILAILDFGSDERRHLRRDGAPRGRDPPRAALRAEPCPPPRRMDIGPPDRERPRRRPREGASSTGT